MALIKLHIKIIHPIALTEMIFHPALLHYKKYRYIFTTFIFLKNYKAGGTAVLMLPIRMGSSPSRWHSFLMDCHSSASDSI